MLRPGFREIISGWMFIDDFEDLTDRIERIRKWSTENGGFNKDEQKYAEFMEQYL